MPVCEQDGHGGWCFDMCGAQGSCGIPDYIYDCEECAVEMGYEVGSEQCDACSNGGNCEFCLCNVNPE